MWKDRDKAARLLSNEQEDIMKENKFFYGWLIVIGGFFIMATCYTIFVNCMSLFLVPITTDLNISRAQFNLCTSISAVVGIFSSLVIGKFLDKYNARLIGAISVLIIVADLIGWAFVNQLWQMYVLAFITGFSVLAGTRLLISVLIANWFDKKRGLAVSLALMGSGFGGVLLSPLINWIMSTSSWRTAFLVLAAITLVVSLPLTIVAFKNRPSDMDLEPYGAGDSSEETRTTSPDTPVLIDIGWNIVRKTSAFWLLILGFVFMGMVNGGVIINISAQMTDAGHTAAFAASILSVYLFTVIIGKICLGAVYDRFGLVAGTVFGSITTILGTLALLFSSSVAGPFAFAIMFGFGTCLGTVAPPIMVVNEFGKKDLGLIVGLVTAFEMLGAAIAAPLTGAVADHYHTYAPAWITLIVVGVLMLITLGISVGKAKKVVASLESA